MRRTLLIGLLGLATLVAPRGATAADLSIEHFAPVPCSVACAYWDVPNAAGFNECSNPFPEGSYDVTKLRFTSHTGVVHIETRAVIDYDTFVCTTHEQPVLVWSCWAAQKCTSIEGECERSPAPGLLAVGCDEATDLTWNALVAANGGINDEFLLISYNWSDYAPLPITITGPAEILDDTYEASIV